MNDDLAYQILEIVVEIPEGKVASYKQIAILAGSWSGSSVAMMKSQDINLFIIPFDKITTLLKKHKIILRLQIIIRRIGMNL